MPNQAPSSVEAISLFSGIGGFEYGLDELGFNFRANLEFDPNCVATLNSNKITSAGRIITPLDITKVVPEDFYDGHVDYIVGGPPCQSFSAAGRRAGGVPGIDDARGTLFWYYCQYVSHFKPKAFVFENVRGILSSNKGADFRIICNSFKDVGYDLFWRVLNSADYGVPQFRERLYLVGVRADLGKPFLFPRPTHGPDSPGQIPYVTASDAIGDLDDPDTLVPPFGGKYGHLIPEIPEGENYRHFTEEMGHPAPQFAWRSKFSGFLYKMAKDVPCRTIVSQQSRYDGPLHWRNRKCTANELKRLQGFPDHLNLDHNYTTIVKQIGNSVTPPVAGRLGMALRYQLEDDTRFQIPLLETEQKLSFDRRKGERARSSRSKKVVTIQNSASPTLFDALEPRTPLVFGKKSKEWTSGDLLITEFRSELDWLFRIHGDREAAHVQWYTLTLHFYGTFKNKVSSITIESEHFADSTSSLREAWFLANRVVRERSSFESLQPLWGHFTEPYPKFSLQFDSSGDDTALRLQAFVTANATSKALVPFSQINLEVGPIQDVLGCASIIGLDVRTRDTNRTIQHGYARFCYPFGF